MIKIFLFKVFFLIFFSIFSLKSFAEEKIAFIDVNYLFNVSLIGKDISNNINKLNQNLNIEATEFQKSIEIDKKNLESKKNILKEEEYKKLYNDLESKKGYQNGLELLGIYKNYDIPEITKYYNSRELDGKNLEVYLSINQSLENELFKSKVKSISNGFARGIARYINLNYKVEHGTTNGFTKPSSPARHHELSAASRRHISAGVTQ